MARYPYIAIEGVIGVGKTTLARLLKPRLGGEVLLEEFEENPFLSDFYADKARYAFQTQIFFLLSRYRQQVTTVLPAMRLGPVIADYTYAKDSLFAHLTLRGDELTMYERVHAALGEKLPSPDLLVFLRANHDVLMGRIAARDRPYERNMDPDYIEQLRIAYEDFVRAYDEAPVLVIDTNDLNIVQNDDDLSFVAQRIKSELALGTYQAPLPGVTGDPVRQPQDILEDLEERPHSLNDFQRFHVSLDAEKGFDPDLFMNFIFLSEEIGELARSLKQTWWTQTEFLQAGKTRDDAHRLALARHRARIEEELADSLAYLLKLSNYAGIDLESAYLEKMTINAHRRWQNGHVVEDEE